MRKSEIKRLAQCAVLAAMPFLFFTPAQANQPQKIAGVPVVQETGKLIIKGQPIALWGIDSLAPDQQCWQGETSWCCGEHALMALRHYVEGRSVECEIQHQADDQGPAIAKCYRVKGPNRFDIARNLIANGWALERGETTGGAYFADEQAAQDNKRGVWSGRFQTAQDWKDGVQKFVGEESPEDTEPAGD